MQSSKEHLFEIEAFKHYTSLYCLFQFNALLLNRISYCLLNCTVNKKHVIKRVNLFEQI